MLHSQPIAISQESSERLNTVAADTYQRYAEIMRDVENLIHDHSKSGLEPQGLRLSARQHNNYHIDVMVHPRQSSSH